MSSHVHPDGGGTPRSLAEALRFRDDALLAALLRARPDLLTPVPNDVTQLAARAGTRASVLRALSRLDRFALQTAEALAVAAEPTGYDTLRTLLTGDPAATTHTASPTTTADPADTANTPDGTVAAALPRALGTLREQALVWGPDDALRLVRTVRELLAPSGQHPSPTGLGPTVVEATAGMSPGRIQQIVTAAGLPTTHDAVSAAAALTALFTDRARMAALLADAPPASLDALTRLLWGPPYGQVTAEPAAHLRWLLDRGLLLPTAPGTVTLPREVALHLRGGRAHRTLDPLPPPIEPTAGRRAHGTRVVDGTAAGQAHSAVGTVEQLLKEWGGAGPGVLRAGGLSVRDLKRAAATLDVPESLAAFWVELAHAAGLLASDGGLADRTDRADQDGDPESSVVARREAERYAPTPAYDDWLELPAAERWATLAAAWLTATRTAGLVGDRDSKDRTLAALGPGLDRSAAPEVRQRVLALLAELPAGTAPDPDALLARLHWERPLKGGYPPASDRQPDRPAPQQGVRHGGQPARARRPSRTLPQATPTDGAPERDDLRSRIAHWTLAEAELLGVTGRGALSSHGRALLGGHDAEPDPVRDTAGPDPAGDTAEPGTTGHTAGPDPAGDTPEPGPAAGVAPLPNRAPRAVAAPLTVAEAAAGAVRAARLLAPLLPEPVDHVLLQADLTAVAPGPLLRPLADLLDVLADVESKGGATVYRFTPGSVRRALDTGRSAGDLHAFLAAHSRTPVPQPLSYLIDDVARRHGRLRVGAAASYLRCDDDAVLGEILADRRSAALGLRRLAPTVLAARVDPAALLDGLRTLGFAPAAESADGDVVITHAAAHRTPPRAAPEPVPEGPPLPDAPLLDAAVRAIRAGDAASTAPRAATQHATDTAQHTATPRRAGGPPRSSTADTLATLQAAVLAGEAVWIGYVDTRGAASRRVIAPVRVEGGLVTAFDHTAEEVRTYPLHRITGVAELVDE